MRSKAVALDQRADAVATGALHVNIQPAPVNVPLRLLRFGEVRQRTGLSRSTIWRMERRGAFPRRIKVSLNVVAWREDEVSEWIRFKLERC
jgi:prophage regulatory protein